MGFSICALVAFTACKKDQENVSESYSDSQITQKLIEFKKTLNAKDGSTLTLDSAKWYLEGLLNYENANNNHEMGEVNLYYDSIIINTDTNQVNSSSLFVAYQALVKKLNGINDAENNLIKFNMISLSIKSGDVSDEHKIIMTVSAGKESKAMKFVPFVTGDAWVFGYGGGCCTTDPYNPNYWNHTSDAAEQLQYKINNSVRSQKTGYYVNISSVVVTEGQWDQYYPGRWTPSTIFLANGTGAYAPESEPCLNDVELNYYLGKFEQVATNAIPHGKSFLNVDIYGVFLGFSGEPVSHWSRGHHYNIFYGDIVSQLPNPTN